MARLRIGIVLGMAVIGLLVAGAGCGPITPAGLAMKGATWVAEQGAKKEYKDYKERKRAEKARRQADQQQNNN